MSKRPIGRNKTRWEDDVLEGIKSINISNWKKAAQNRDSWKKVVEQARKLYRRRRHISLHTFSTEFAFKTPRAVTRAPSPPPAGALRMTAALQTRSIPETLHCHEERGQGRLATTVTSPGVGIRFGLPRRNLFIPGLF